MKLTKHVHFPINTFLPIAKCITIQWIQMRGSKHEHMRIGPDLYMQNDDLDMFQMLNYIVLSQNVGIV